MGAPQMQFLRREGIRHSEVRGCGLRHREEGIQSPGPPAPGGTEAWPGDPAHPLLLPPAPPPRAGLVRNGGTFSFRTSKLPSQTCPFPLTFKGHVCGCQLAPEWKGHPHLATAPGTKYHMFGGTSRDKTWEGSVCGAQSLAQQEPKSWNNLKNSVICGTWRE